ncbi:MAG: hypothetical protein DRJ03_24205 [Chloroflexi bacterium]|nr:MAG: hypothetical protein DRI81_17540 [Chloroflexota bacterium]RLC79029.1 MAG: hypothetical protein DRJ03_24205 [Chloroflexota bacterium]
MTKIAVCGKGGSGKSSTVALLANGLREREYSVLVVDSDESNPGLYRLLGFEKRPDPLLDLVGGKKKVFATLKKKPSGNILTQEEIRTQDIPPQYMVERNGIRLVCVGKILQSLEGCACPMGALNREFLKRLVLHENEVVLIDMEAGIEHFGRGIEQNVDSVIAVTEPSFDSLELAEKIHTLAREVGVRDSWALLNNVRSNDLASELRAGLEGKGIPVIGSIGYETEVFRAGLEGRPISSDDVSGDIGSILDQLL